MLDTLSNNFYRHWAVPPVTTSLVEKEEALPPVNLHIQRCADKLSLVWNAPIDSGKQNQTAYYIVYAFKSGLPIDKNRAENICCLTAENSIDIMSIASLKGDYVFGVTAVNRYRKESELILLENKSFHF